MSTNNTVLVIDDEIHLRRSLTLILQRNGYRVTCAGTAQEGLTALAAGSYDLVFLDLKLPDRDGLTILPEIHRLYPEMPVVILTAHATLESAMQAIRRGADDYLLKPIQPELILQRLDEILVNRKDSLRRKEILSEMKGLLDELHQIDGMDDGRSALPAPGVADPTRYLRKGSFVLDLHSRRVVLGDREVTIPPSSFDYLVVLVRHSPDPVPFVSLVSEAQGFSTTLQEARELARLHIHELRKAIEADLNNPHYIITARNIGYQFVA